MASRDLKLSRELKSTELGRLLNRLINLSLKNERTERISDIAVVSSIAIPQTVSL